jgi:hypothetical protein
MALINFSERFAEMVRVKVKRQTIRPPRKRPVKIGETIHLYAGLWTKRARKLGTARCCDYQKITIRHEGIEFVFGFCPKPNELAHGDGFLNWEDMRNWFKDKYGLPFHGVLIRWI